MWTGSYSDLDITPPLFIKKKKRKKKFYTYDYNYNISKWDSLRSFGLGELLPERKDDHP